MTINYTTLLGLAKPVTGTESGQWGDVVNDQITTLVEDAVANASSISVTAGNVTLTTTTGAANQARMSTLIITGTPGTTRNVVAPSQAKVYVVINQSNAAVVVKGAATTGVTIGAGQTAQIAWNGSDFVEIGNYVHGNFVVNGNLSVNGNSTLGDGGADITTINGQFVGANANISKATTLSTSAPAFFWLEGATYTDTGTAGGTTQPHATFHQIDAPTVNTSNIVTYTNASTLYIAGAPSAAGSATITNPYALFINGGASHFGAAVTMAATTQNLALGTSQTTGTWTAGGTAQTGTITLDRSTKAHTLNLGTGATESATTKTINIGTAGVSGSTTTINLGSSVSGATSAFNVYGASAFDSAANALTVDLNSNNVNGLYVRFKNSNVGIGDIGAGASVISGGTAGEFGITSRAGALLLGQNTSEVVRIASSNVGINMGGLTPSMTLDVRGALGTGIQYYDNSSGNSVRVQLGTASQTAFINADAGVGAISLALRVGGSTKATINQAGVLFAGTVDNIASGPIALFTGTVANQPVIKIKGAQLNGMTLFGDQYGLDESLTSYGIAYSSASTIIGSSVAPSTTVDTGFISTQDTGSTRGAAIRLDGSAGAISFWNSDTNSTVTTGSARTLTQNLTLTSVGRLGVGLTAPDYRISADCGSAANNDAGISVYNSNNSGYGGSYNFQHRLNTGTAIVRASYISSEGGGGGSFMRLATTSTAGVLDERVRITSAGLVGIGTTTPSYRLVVSNSGASGMEFGPAYSGTDNLFQNYNRSAAAYVNCIYEALSHRFNASSGLSCLVDSTARFIVNTTDTGAEGLNISSARNLSFTEGSGTSYVNMFRQAGSAATVIANGYKYSATSNGFASSIGVSWAKSALLLDYGVIRFYTNTAATVANGTDVTPTQRMILTSAGELMINATAPNASEKLKVTGAGSTGATYIIYFENAANTRCFAIEGDGRIYSGTAASSPYNLTTASAANMYVDSNGILYRSTSSRKYKTDVQNATHGLAEVMQLRPVTYKGKNDGDTVFGGLIAEEVHAAGLTEFVQYAEDGSPDALAYGNMVSLLTKAIQEQQAIIEDLRARVAALETP